MEGDCDAGAGEFTLQVSGGAAEFGPSGEPIGEQDLASEPAGGFVEDDAVASFCGDGGGFHADGAASGDQDGAAVDGGCPAPVAEFPPGFGMLDAGDRIPRVEVADAGLIAGDAGTDVVGAALGRQCWHD